MARLAQSLRLIVLFGVALSVLGDGSEPNDGTPTDGRQTEPVRADDPDSAELTPVHRPGDETEAGEAEPRNDDRKPDTVDTDFLDEQHSANTNCTSNDTSCLNEGDPGVRGYFRKMVSDNKDMLLRTFYVVISITGIIVVYFIIKMVRTRQRESRTKRYGLLTSRDDHLEMTPLDVDDDEDDMTLFDVNQTK